MLGCCWLCAWFGVLFGIGGGFAWGWFGWLLCVLYLLDGLEFLVV